MRFLVNLILSGNIGGSITSIMKTFKKAIVELKNEKQVSIRQAEIADAETLLNTIKTYLADSDYVPLLATEIKWTIEDREEWIKSFLANENSLLLVAEYQNQILGNIDLTGSRRKIMEHTAVVGMGMLKEWRNTGLGTALLTHAIDWAKQNPILELIWLQVYTQNVLGLNIYKKMGFQDNGIIKNYFKHGEQYFDNLTMTLDVK